jgi:two-component system nitrate/nitrite response regulator NarL
LARQLLAAMPGLRVVADAATGQEGLALARVLQPDIVLLDVNLPDVDGIEVCRQLRLERPAPTVILVSADDELEYAAAARASGAVAFVSKQRLTSRLLETVLRQQRDAAEPPGREGESSA